MSRGAVREGKLYNHKLFSPKPREQSKVDVRPTQEVPTTTSQRGVLRIQPGKVEQNKPAQNRGGLLYIDSNVTKPSNNKSNKRGPQPSELKKDVILLRKDKDVQHLPGHQDDYSSRAVNQITLLGPQQVTTEHILNEVKEAYQEIQTLESKVKALYNTDDMDQRSRRRPSTDASTWTSYSKIHQEYSPLHGNMTNLDSSDNTTLL
jgi:hypothetical protein